ncbi:MAG: hypothetical protein J6F30_10770 [Cellulosilyticum sp.]|nr:hypothetical protein [Cellulosilyticum sp.]
MKHLVKLLITQKGIRRTPSIYISIILAYLEMKEWTKAQSIVEVMEALEMRPEEAEAYQYLKHLIQSHNQEDLEDLWAYLRV